MQSLIKLNQTGLEKGGAFKAFLSYNQNVKHEFSNRISILLFFLFCFNVFGVETNQENADLSDTLQGENPAIRYMETAQLNLKGGLKHLFGPRKRKVWQIPVLLEFQVPIITASGSIKWLIQAGGGWWHVWHKYPLCSLFSSSPERPKYPFDSEFFQRHYREDLMEHEERKKHCYSFPYVVTQTGLKYDFQPVHLSLVGGAIVSFGGPRTMGLTGGLLLGWKIQDALYVELGAETLYYDRFYWGLSFSIGFVLKRWWEKFSI